MNGQKPNSHYESKGRDSTDQKIRYRNLTWKAPQQANDTKKPKPIRTSFSSSGGLPTPSERSGTEYFSSPVQSLAAEPHLMEVDETPSSGPARLHSSVSAPVAQMGPADPREKISFSMKKPEASGSGAPTRQSSSEASAGASESDLVNELCRQFDDRDQSFTATILMLQEKGAYEKRRKQIERDIKRYGTFYLGRDGEDDYAVELKQYDDKIENLQRKIQDYSRQRHDRILSLARLIVARGRKTQDSAEGLPSPITTPAPTSTKTASKPSNGDGNDFEDLRNRIKLLEDNAKAPKTVTNSELEVVDLRNRVKLLENALQDANKKLDEHKERVLKDSAQQKANSLEMNELRKQASSVKDEVNNLVKYPSQVESVQKSCKAVEKDLKELQLNVSKRAEASSESSAKIAADVLANPAFKRFDELTKSLEADITQVKNSQEKLQSENRDALQSATDAFDGRLQETKRDLQQFTSRLEESQKQLEALKRTATSEKHSAGTSWGAKESTSPSVRMNQPVNANIAPQAIRQLVEDMRSRLMGHEGWLQSLSMRMDNTNGQEQARRLLELLRDQFPNAKKLIANIEELRVFQESAQKELQNQRENLNQLVAKAESDRSAIETLRSNVSANSNRLDELSKAKKESDDLVINTMGPKIGYLETIIKHLDDGSKRDSGQDSANGPGGADGIQDTITVTPRAVADRSLSNGSIDLGRSLFDNEDGTSKKRRREH